MAELQFPNFMAAQQEGYKYGNQLMENNRALQQQNALRQLAPQVISGDPAAYARAAAISPEAAQKYDEAGTAPLKKFQGLIAYMERARATGNQNAVNAALREAAPLITRMTGKPAPTEWTPDMDAGWEQLKAKVAMAESGGAQGNVQSVRVGEDGFYYNVYRDGRIVNTGVKANPNIRVLEQEGALPYGVVTSGGVAGTVVPLGGGVPAQSAPPTGAPVDIPSGLVRTASGELVRLDPSIPAADREAVIAGRINENGAFQSVPAIQSAPQAVSQPVGPVRIPTAAERAAAEAAARRKVELETLPAELDMRTGAAIAQTAGQERVKADIGLQTEQSGKQRERSVALNMYETAMQGLRAGLEGTETGPIVGRIPAVTSGQQTAEGAVAAMAPILKQLFRTAGEGTFTDRDQDLLLRMVPTRTDLPAARAAKIANIDNIVRAKLGQPVAGAMGGAASTVERRARNPQTGETLVLRNGQWVPER